MIIIFILICAIAAIFSVNLNKVEYSNFTDAKKTSDVVQIIGKPDTSSEKFEQDSEKVKFTFLLKDRQNKTDEVVYFNAKPMNFDYAEYVVVRGSYRNGIFTADEILTKCPSKYEGELAKRKRK